MFLASALLESAGCLLGHYRTEDPNQTRADQVHELVSHLMPDLTRERTWFRLLGPYLDHRFPGPERRLVARDPLWVARCTVTLPVSAA